MRAYRASRRAALVKGLLPYAGKAHLLAPSVPWLQRLLDTSQVAEETRRQAAEARCLEAQLKTAQKALDSAEERVEVLEREKRNREARQLRQRERREGGIILPSDPAAIRDHYAQDRPSPFAAQIAPRIGPNPGQIDPRIRPNSGQNPPTFAPGIGQESDKIIPRDGQDWLRYVGIPSAPIAPPRSATPAPAPAAKAGGLLEKIKKAGYQTNAAGLVLYNNERWISPEEWAKRMGNVLD